MSCFCAVEQQISARDTFCVCHSLLVIHFVFSLCVGHTFCMLAVSVYHLFPYQYFTKCTLMKLRCAMMFSS